MSALKRDVHFLKCLDNVKLGKLAGGGGGQMLPVGSLALGTSFLLIVNSVKGWLLRSIFDEYVLLAYQNPYSVIIYFWSIICVANL